MVARVQMTVSCRDADSIPKVDDAGGIRSTSGMRVQVMHNGLLVEEGCYYGPWMTEIIRCLRGHHEPQEEKVFHAILERLSHTGTGIPPTIVELGSFWAYYGMWFAKAFSSARVVAMEPDPAYLEVGKRNFALNRLEATFVHGAIAPDTSGTTAFTAESDGQGYDVPSHSLESLLETAGIDRCDVVLADIQGAETPMLEAARSLLASGRIRFLIISTHHHSISGDPLTHQNALQLLQNLGAQVIAEHSVGESFSGDGLIAVSFDDRDKDFDVGISHARQRQSLFGELEYDVARERSESAGLRQDVARLADELRAMQEERSALAHQIDAIQATKLWRWSSIPRRVYARLR
jgi:FkbM family methyltransferase